jgi:DNA-binding transcriptional LysR family regulator
VELLIGNTETALDALKNHRADVAFVEGLVSGSGLIATFWRPDRLEIVVGANHAKVGKKALTPADVQKLKWILREPGSGTRQLFESALRAAALEPVSPLLTLDDTEAVIQAVSTGVAASCLSQLCVSDALRAKRLVALPAPFLALDRSLWRVTRRDARLGPLLLALDEHLSNASA